MPPDLFAVVMATGVVSLAAVKLHYPRIGLWLGVLAVVTFAVLGLGVVVRVMVGPGRVFRSARDPDVALRMFTFVAACTVLAARWSPGSPWGETLIGLGVAGWLVLMPLAGLDVRARRPQQLREHAHGAWLLPSVATHGLAIDAASVAVGHHLTVVAVLAAAAWVLGALIYVAAAGLIIWRVLGRPLTPETITPDSWILMGCLAITAVAATHLLTVARVLHAPPGAVTGASAAVWGSWVLASLWIPVLLYAELWRVDHLTGSLRYQGAWWSVVFPIGMYSLACYELAAVMGIRALRTVSLVFFWNALALWVLVATGLGHIAVCQVTVAPRKTGAAGQTGSR